MPRQRRKFRSQNLPDQQAAKDHGPILDALNITTPLDQCLTTQGSRSEAVKGIFSKYAEGQIENYIVKSQRAMLKEIGAGEDDPRMKALSRIAKQQEYV